MTEFRAEIDRSLVSRLVSSQFPQWAQLPIRAVATSGWDNRTFHLGEEMLVRLPSAECYAGQIEKEQIWLPQLGPLLPLKIPEPLAMGEPAEGYPWRWSVYRWLPGQAAAVDQGRQPSFGADLAGFLIALHRIDSTGGPSPGDHNFHRGGALSIYDTAVREAIRRLRGAPEAKASTALWDAVVATRWKRKPVWVHGDLAADNLLCEDDRLAGVIDWGNCAGGDPACDLTIAWTFLDGDGRKSFRNALSLDDATWDRARGWALWKALILATGLVHGPSAQVEQARLVLDRLLGDQAAIRR